jgi:hypothetical protein
VSAAFQLDYSGPPVRCDFPGCTLNAWHEGEHSLFVPKPPERHFDRVCKECGHAFAVPWGAQYLPHDTCGSPECILSASKRDPITIPVFCPCPQRPYPHELAIHFELRSEAYNPKFKFRWPWSLCLSPRLEFSAERRS